MTWQFMLCNVLPVVQEKQPQIALERRHGESWRIMENQQFHTILTFPKIRQASHASLVCPRLSIALSFRARAGWRKSTRQISVKSGSLKTWHGPRLGIGQKGLILGLQHTAIHEGHTVALRVTCRNNGDPSGLARDHTLHC